MQLHVHVSQSHTELRICWGLDNTIEKKRYKKEVITMSSTVYSMFWGHILNCCTSLIVWFKKEDILKYYTMDLGVLKASAGPWDAGQALNYSKKERFHSLVPNNGLRPTTDLSLYILYVLYVCIIKWSQVVWRMMKPLQHQLLPLGSEKVSRNLFWDLMYITDPAPDCTDLS